jgi:hypothetical protein
MSVIYQADVLNSDGNVFDTLEVGGDDGSLPVLEMGPDTARQELEQLAHDEYGRPRSTSALCMSRGRQADGHHRLHHTG